MKKIIQLSLIIVATVFLGACTLQKGGDDSSQSKQEKKAMSLKDLVNLGVAQKCTWSFEEEGNQMTGQILVKGKKFNQVAKINGPQGLMEFNSISDGEYVYSWSDDPAAGGMAFKIKLEESEEQTADNQGQMDWNNQYDFDCSPTVLSDKDFTPPQGMEFMDMNDLKNSFSIPE
jgi:hypothetical protein